MRDTGDIIRKKGDYTQRQGVCDVPISESDLTNNIPVCHSKIRTFEWIIKLITRELSHKKWWSAAKPVVYSEEERELYRLKEETIKQELLRKIVVNIGNPGDMVTGGAFQTLSSDNSRHIICHLVDEQIQDELGQILLGLAAAVKVINSQRRKVNIERFRSLTTEVYSKIVEVFPWAVISPSVHRILAHS